MNEKDKRILSKIVAKQSELSAIACEFNINCTSDLGATNPVVR